MTQSDEPQAKSSQEDSTGTGKAIDHEEDKPDNASEEDTSDKMEVEVPVVENEEMDVDEGALQPGQPSGQADSNVITHQELSDENNLNEEYTCIIEELNLPKASIEKYCKRLAELKEESNNIQYRVVWEAFHELIENDQLMESMAWLDDLDEPGDEDPIGLTLVDGSDDSIPLNRLQGLGKSDKVARMPVDQESDTGLTDTEEEDNDSLETQTEADDDDKKPRAKPVAASKKRIIPKAPRKVPVKRQSKKKLPTQASTHTISKQPRRAARRKPRKKNSEDEIVEYDLPVLYNNLSDFPRRISDIIGIAEANLTHELCRLPAVHFTDKNLVNLVAARWKKHGSDYQWPPPPLDLTTGPGGRAFVTWEQQQQEAQRRKQLKEGHEEYAKNCWHELVGEKERYNKRITKQVNRLLRLHFGKHQDKKTKKISDSETAVKEITKAMNKEFGFSNKMNMAEQRQVTKMVNKMTKATKTKYDKHLKAISEVAYIRFRPAGIDAKNEPYIATFDVRKANDPKCIHLINTEWIASWLSIVYFRLATKLPNVWLHVPIGNSRADLAPGHTLTNIPLRYPQGELNLCLIKALASTLYYMGLFGESGRLNLCSYKYEHLSLEEARENLQKDMKQCCPCIGIGRGFNLPRGVGVRSKKNRKAKMTLQNLLEDKSPFPTVIIPRGTDMSVNHAVCVIDDIIFDSTQPKALWLTKETLDWICGGQGCEGIHLALRFERGFNTSTLKRDLQLHK